MAKKLKENKRDEFKNKLVGIMDELDDLGYKVRQMIKELKLLE